MESQLVALLSKLHSEGFSDPKELCQNIRTLVLDEELSPELIAYSSNKLFNSDIDLLKYAEQSIRQKDKQADETRRYAYLLIGDYVKLRKDTLMDYLLLIFTKAHQFFMREQGNKAKEATLRIIAKIVKHVSNSECLEEILKPKSLCDYFLMHLKSYKPVPTVKGYIWQLLGLLYNRYPASMDVRTKKEVQEICLKQIEKIVETDKNTTALARMIKSFNETLQENYLETEVLNKLFKYLTTLMLPCKDTYEVPRSALKVLANHANLFHANILASAKTIFTNCIDLMSHKNRELKQRASEAMEAITVEIAKGIFDEPQKYEQLYNFIMTTFWDIIKQQAFVNNRDDPTRNMESAGKMVSIIKTVGFFSRVIVVISGKEQLKLFFHKLLEICDRRMIKSFESQDLQKYEGQWTAKHAKSMKSILYGHKQIYSFIGSFARIIEHLDEISYTDAENLERLFVLAIKQYAYFYEKYRPFLLEAMVSLIISFSAQSQLFSKWLKRTIMNSLKESLDSNRFMIAVDDDYFFMVRKACQLWSRVIQQTQWTGATLMQFAGVFFDSVEHLIKNLDVSYKSILEEESSNQNELANVFSKSSERLVPTNLSDFQYMASLVLLFDHIMQLLDPELYIDRVFGLYSDILRRFKILPKSVSLMKICRTLNEFINRTNYFERVSQIKRDELVPCIRDLFNEIFESLIKHQGDILYEALKVLMSTPIEVISLANYKILKYHLPSVLLKSLEMGQEVPSLAYSALRCLEQLYTSPERKRVEESLKMVIPEFEKYISVRENSESKESLLGLFLREHSITKKTIMTETLRFLGRMGGLIHSIVPDLKRQEEKTQIKNDGKSAEDDYISWDYDCTLTFPLPLINRKADLKLTKLLPRVMQLMLNSTDESVKTTSCEFMHAVIIYIIGRSASDPKRNMSEAELAEQNSFKERCSRIYAKILPTVFKVSCNKEHPSHQLMHTLSVQLIHFLSKTRQPNSPDIVVMLNILVEMLSQSKDISQFATKCLAELVKWNIKQQIEGAKEYPLIKMVVRNLWSLTASKNIKEGTVSLMTEILKIIHKEEPLMTKYILEFCSLLLTLSRNNRPPEPSLLYLVEKLVLSMKPYVKTLMVEQQAVRTGRFSSIGTLLEWLYECGIFSSFSQQRTVSYLLWEKILTNYSVLLGTEVREFLYQRAKKETKTLFQRMEDINFEGTDSLIAGCNSLVGYTDLWSTIITKGYFEIDKVVLFRDFEGVFIGSAASFFRQLIKLQNSKDMLGEVRNLTEQAQEAALECFSKLVELFSSLLLNKDISRGIAANLLDKISPVELTGLLVSMIRKPHDVIRTVSSDLILMRYPGFFRNCSTVLEIVSQGRLQEFLSNQYQMLFDYDQSSSLLEFIVYRSNLYDSQLLVFLKGHAELDRVLILFGHAQMMGREITRVMELVEQNVTQNKKEISSERCLMLLRFTLEHTDVGEVQEYVHRSITSNSPVFQKYEKYFLQFLAANWSACGKRLLNEAVRAIGLMKVLFSLSRLLQKKQLETFFEWLPLLPASSSTPADLLEELVKFNFVLLSDSQKIPDQTYLIYVSGLLRISMGIQNSLQLHDCSMNLLSVLLLNEAFKNAYMKEFKDSVRLIRQNYLPTRMVDLKEEKHKNEFTIFFKGFRNLLIISQQISLFETVLNILRQNISGYYNTLIHQTIQQFISVGFCKKEGTVQRSALAWSFNTFFDESIDQSQYENARIAVAEKIIVRLLANISEPTAIDMMDEYLPRLLALIKAPFIPGSNADAICFQLLTKKAAYNLIEGIYKKVPPKSKAPERVHQKEYHKELIRMSHETVKKKSEHEDLLKQHAKKTENPCLTILRDYHCAAYNCLIVLFISTQSKKDHYKTYIFEKKPGQLLWEQLIDTTKENLGFEVETQFEIMKPIEALNKPISNRIKNRYCDSSLFTIEEECVPKSIQPEFDVESLPTIKMEVESQATVVSGPVSSSATQQPVLELDIINQHPCMVNLLMLIDHMQAHFSDGGMPAWMESIFEELTQESLSINIRVFLLKIILNRPGVFTQQLWLAELLKYLGLKDNGSKGLHYFYRDVAKQALAFQKMGYRSEGRIPSAAVNKMMRMLPHENGYLFTYNVELFEGMLKFEKVYIEEKAVFQMLRFEQGKPDYLEWRLTGVIVVKSAVASKTPILPTYEDLAKATNLEERLRFFYKLCDVQQLRLVERMLEEGKVKHAVAAAGLLGELMKFLTEHPQGNSKEKILQYLSTQLAALSEHKNRSCRERISSILHQIIQIFPPFLEEMKVSSLVQTILNNSAKRDRALAIDCYRILCQHLQKKRISLNDLLFQLSLRLRGAVPRIVLDDTEVQRSLISLLAFLSDPAILINKDIYCMFYNIFDELDRTYSKSTDEPNAIAFFRIVVRIDDSLTNNKMEDETYADFMTKVKKTLISGLASNHREVNRLIFEHFEHSKKEYHSPAERLLELCSSLYVPEFEELWLTSTVPLLLSLSKRSSDYDRLIFEESLDKLANYYDWDFRHNFKDNASQPYTPAHTLVTQALKRDGLASVIASQGESAGEHLEGMLRASQNSYLMENSPVFTVNSDNIFSQSSEVSHPSQQLSASERPVDASGFPKPTLMSIFKGAHRKKPSEMSQFLASNAISYNKIKVVDSKVRFSKQNTAGVANVEEAINRQTELYLKRVNQKNQRGMLVRKYKVGELPDIQICGRDLIDPLMLLAFNDNEFAGELFTLLFECICRIDSRESVRQFKGLLPELLNKSQKHNFGFVSTMQKGLITLMKQLNEKVDCRMLPIAQKSNSYEYSVLFVEENLIQMADEDTVEISKVVSGVSSDVTNIEFENWIDLMELYHHLYQTDQVQGVLLKVMGAKERERLGEVFVSKNKGLIHEAKRTLDEVLSVCGNNRLKQFLEDEKIDCDTLLSNWEEIGKELKSKPIDTQRTDLENRLLITSLISTSRSNEELAELSTMSKQLKLDRLFYEQAVLRIASRTEIDSAIYLTSQEEQYFIGQWSKLSSFAMRSKHELLQIVQKNYELKEFIGLYSNVDLKVADCRRLFKTWTERSPSAVHDGHLSWMQLLEARLLYARLMEQRYSVPHDIITSASTDWYVQIGVGMVKKGLLGGAQTLMKKAIMGKRGSKVFPWDFYKSTAKLKLKQLMVQIQPDIVQNALYEFEQTPNVIRREMEKFEDVAEETKMFMNLMQVKFYEAFLDKHSSNIADAKTPAFFINLYASTIDKTFSLMKKICVSDLIKKDNNENLKLKRKAYVTLTCFTERLLTLLEEPFEVKPLKTILAGNKLTAEYISSMFAQSLIKSLQFAGVGRQDKSDIREKSSTDYLSSLILKLLKVVQRHSDILGDIFVEAIDEKKIPVWLFLYFLPQTVSVLNLECSKYFEEMFMGICELYPEALIYQFNSQFERRHLCKTQTSQKIYDYLHQKHPVHFLFIDALDNLTHPELRLKDSLMRLREKDTQNEAILEMDEMINNGQYYGKYNKKYVEERSRKIGRIINMFRSNDRGWLSEVDEILKGDDMKNMKIPKGFLTLSDFSVFFDEYASNDWPRIMLPGQFNSCGEEPVKQTIVTIQSFDQSILALNSLRRPKRLTLYGNNEKKYMFLVKGGEDLRLDQRIEQLFGVVNRIMDRNCQCEKRELFLRRFEVTPMKRWMGLLQWVNNTEVLKDFVEREYKEVRDPKGDLFTQNKSYEARIKFLSTLSGEKDRILMHKPLLSCDERQIVANLKKCEFMMPYGLLRRAIERLSKNYDSYLHLKNRFISNFAVASVVCYLLGIGDRHLENFLVHIPTATIILIDFGYSFGASLDLPLPELVPFRLTKIFRQLMDPIGVNGNFKASMVHSMFALRSKWHQLIDFCEVFVNDPVLDWAYMARKKRVIRTVIGAGGNSMSQEVEQDQSFFKKKIEYVQNKLQGKNPRILLSQAIGDSKHKDVPGIRKMIEGSKLLKPMVSATEQIELLIELATDKNILGRAFTPWCPYV